MKKTTALLLVALFMFMAFAGCGSNLKTTETSSVVNTVSGADTTTQSQAVKKDYDLHMVFSVPRFKTQIEDFINKYKAKFSDKYNVNVTLEMPSSDQAATVIKAKLSAGDAIDIYTLHAVNDLPTFYKAGYVEDLSQQLFGEKLADNARASVTIDGKVLALPMESLVWGLLYNTDIFTREGLKPPRTLSELKVICEKLKADGYTPFLLSYKEDWIPQLFNSLIVGALTNTSNKDFIEKMSRNQSSFSELKDYFNVIDLVHQYGSDKPFDLDGTNGCAAFAQGKAAMWVQGPWYAESILQANPDFKFQVAPLPINDDPDATLLNIGFSTSLAVTKTSKSKEAAFDFLNYMLDDEVTDELFQSLKFNPVAKNQTFNAYDYLSEATQLVKEGKSYMDPYLPPAVKNDVGKLIQGYYTKKYTKEQVFSALDKDWKTSNESNQ